MPETLTIPPRLAAQLMIRLAGPKLTPIARAVLPIEHEMARAFLDSVEKSKQQASIAALEEALTVPGTGAMESLINDVIDVLENNLLGANASLRTAVSRMAATKSVFIEAIPTAMVAGAEATALCVVETPEIRVKNTAKRLGFPEAQVTVLPAEEGPLFSVGARQFKTAGYYYPKSKTITIFADEATSKEAIDRIVAHEVQHYKFDKVFEEFQRERDIMRASNWEALRMDGSIRPEFASQFPVNARLQPFLEGTHYQKLQVKDGHTEYSKSYWEAWSKGQSFPKAIYTPIDETLAEISAIQAIQGNLTGVDTLWRKFYKEINDIFKGIQ